MQVIHTLYKGIVNEWLNSPLRVAILSAAPNLYLIEPTLADISRFVIDTKPLKETTFMNGQMDAADVVFHAVNVPVESASIYLDTGDPKTSKLLVSLDDGGFPVDTRGGDVTLEWAADGIVRFDVSDADIAVPTSWEPAWL